VEPHGAFLDRHGDAALAWATEYLREIGDRRPVLSPAAPGEIRAALPASPPAEPEPFEAVLADLEGPLARGLTHWQSPGFFGYFAVTGSEPAILAELLVATLNQVGINWRASPLLQELEEVTTDWLRQLVGLPEGFHGQLEDAASLSTTIALAAARGARPDRRTVVMSEHAHSSVEKACRLLGLEPRKIPADGDHRLRADLLDLEGACAAVGTIGTTSCASIDPIPELAGACAAAGVWLHLDTAYAGSAAILPELRHLFAGWERADSIVCNPHKWLSLTQGCSVLWTRRRDDVRAAFSLVPEYLRTGDDVVSHAEYSQVLGRGFRALPLWAVLRCHGANGLQAVLREHIRLGALFEGWVRAEPGWEVVAPRHFSLVCFRREGSDEGNETLLERVNAGGEIFLSHTRLDGRFVLRLAIGSARTTEADVRRAWDVLRAAA
jgi:aromatic-L-amino-acid decarboxylase